MTNLINRAAQTLQSIRLMKEAKYRLIQPVVAHVRSVGKSRQLTAVSLQKGLKSARFVVILSVHNERPRLPHLLQYYRDLGFEHFVVIDNRSTDGLLESLENEQDVSVFYADGRYRDARYGIDWVNHLCGRYCRGKWVLHIDADEYLVFSDDGSGASVDQLTTELRLRGKRALQTMMLDMYSALPASENVVDEGEDPLSVCFLYDQAGYIHRFESATGVTWIKGGVRGRVFFKNDVWAGPALNKTPLIRWRATDCFLKSTHEAWPRGLNGNGEVNGLLLHFKFTTAAVARMVAGSSRDEHTEEYKNYTKSDQVVMADIRLTRSYEGTFSTDEGRLFDPLVK